MNPRELEQAIQDAFNDGLDDARGAALRDALRHSPEAVDAYCDHAILETELQYLAANRRAVPEDVRAGRLLLNQRRGKRVLLFSAAAAAVLLVAGMIWQRGVTTATDRVIARLEVSPGSTLSHEDGKVFSDLDLGENQTFVLGQGVARLAFKSGVEAVIEGPAMVKLMAVGQMALESGHSWFHVPRNARGFKVTTPDFEVTDLGTEFGIDLRRDHRPQAHVLLGRIEVSARTGDEKPVMLQAGDALALDPSGEWTRFAADFHKFRTTLPKSIPSLKMDFDHLENAELSIKGDILGVEGSVAKVVRPDLVKLVPGIVGNAIQLNGDGASIETTWQGISGSAPRTVSLWCKLPKGTKFDTAPPLAWWGDPATPGNKKFKVALITNPRGATVLRASFGDIQIDGRSNLADDSWHHLAVVYRGNQADGNPDLSIYIDGASEAISPPGGSNAPIETDSRSENAGSLAIGKYELPAWGRNPFLRATLDEFQVFAGALEEREIRALAAPE